MFQSTHPHGVRPVDFPNSLSPVMFQSTHPHGVRLTNTIANNQRALVSIHAPARGATCLPRRCLHPGRVSIHAPARGATIFNITSFLSMVFQSTHPHGVRPTTSALLSRIFQFQSTHPHGVRHRATQEVTPIGGFQSTHPHGVRQRFAKTSGELK